MFPRVCLFVFVVGLGGCCSTPNSSLGPTPSTNDVQKSLDDLKSQLADARATIADLRKQLAADRTRLDEDRKFQERLEGKLYDPPEKR